MSGLAAFAELAAAVAFDDLAPEQVEAARKRIFDNLCATAVGLTIADGQVLRELANAGSGPDLSVADAVALYVAATRATETDDISIACCVTAGSVIVPVATTLAARMAVDDKALIAAVVVGYEAAIRLGVALDGANLIYKGAWPTYLVAPFTAAAVAAKLMGLERRATANALALALSRTPRWLGRSFDGLSPRWALLGAAATEGMFAANAAAAGLGGDAGILTAFSEAVGAEIDSKALAEPAGFGDAVLAVDAKTYPTSRQGLAATEAFLAQTPLQRSIAEIEQVEVLLPSAYLQMVSRTQLPGNRLESLTSVAYQMALAAFDPDRLFDCGRDDLRKDEETAGFMAKVVLREDSLLTAAFPAEWGGGVRIVWRGGRAQQLTIRDPEGSARRPLDWAALNRKAWRLMSASGLNPGLLEPLQQDCEALATRAHGAAAPRLIGAVERLSARRTPAIARRVKSKDL